MYQVFLDDFQSKKELEDYLSEKKEEIKEHKTKAYVAFPQLSVFERITGESIRELILRNKFEDIEKELEKKFNIKNFEFIKKTKKDYEEEKRKEEEEKEKEKFEKERLEAEKKPSEKYADFRKLEYPSISEQLDKIYHEGLDSWKKEIKKVKDKYKKP